MNESQLLDRIHTITGHGNQALLARFWLQMDARPMDPPFTFSDFRHLDSEGRSVFHSILGSYRREQFAPLDGQLVSCLMLLALPRVHRYALLAARSGILHYYPVQRSSLIRPAILEGVTT